MAKTVLAFSALLVLLLCTGAPAQEYELDWNDLHASVREADDYTLEWPHTEEAVCLNVQPKVPEPRVTAPTGQPMRVAPEAAKRSPLPAPPAHLQLTVAQFFDYDRQEYRIVDRVEVTVYPEGGGVKYSTFQNLGALREYDVFIKSLSPGDRYKAFLVWDDGSNRTVEGTIQGTGWRTVYVDQPNPLGYKVWPTPQW